MARHSFIQMSKLPNVKGRISYITSKAKQENLYATYRTADNTFWNDLAKIVLTPKTTPQGRTPALRDYIEKPYSSIISTKNWAIEKDRQLQRCIHRTAAGYLSTQLLRLFAQSLTKLSFCAIINKQIYLFIFERRSNLD